MNSRYVCCKWIFSFPSCLSIWQQRGQRNRGKSIAWKHWLFVLELLFVCHCRGPGIRQAVLQLSSFFFFCFPFINWWENKGSVLHCLQRQWTCLLCASRAIKKKFVLMVHVFAFHRAANNSRDEVYTKHAAQKQALLQRGAVGSTLSTHRPIYEERSMHLRTFHCTFGERASIFGILTNEGTPASVIPLCRYHPSATCGGH